MATIEVGSRRAVSSGKFLSFFRGESIRDSVWGTGTAGHLSPRASLRGARFFHATWREILFTLESIAGSVFTTNEAAIPVGK